MERSGTCQIHVSGKNSCLDLFCQIFQQFFLS
jgi:hypothetical protein